MARLNIEDSLYRDQRWLKLLEKTKCRFKALGLVINAWTLAQRNWLENKSIPKKAWDNDLNILLDVGLAQKNKDGSYYVNGSKKQFAWLDQRSNAGKHKNRQNQHTKKVERDGTGRNGTEPLTLSPSLTHNYKELTTKRAHASLKKDANNAVKDFIVVYDKALKTRYGNKAKLVITPKIAGQIKKLVFDIGLVKACDLIQVYFQMDDQWFLKRAHDFSTFLNNLQKIAISLDTGLENPTTSDKSISELLAEREKNVKRV